MHETILCDSSERSHREIVHDDDGYTAFESRRVREVASFITVRAEQDHSNLQNGFMVPFIGIFHNENADSDIEIEQAQAKLRLEVAQPKERANSYIESTDVNEHSHRESTGVAVPPEIIEILDDGISHSARNRKVNAVPCIEIIDSESGPPLPVERYMESYRMARRELFSNTVAFPEKKNSDSPSTA